LFGWNACHCFETIFSKMAAKGTSSLWTKNLRRDAIPTSGKANSPPEKPLTQKDKDLEIALAQKVAGKRGRGTSAKRRKPRKTRPKKSRPKKRKTVKRRPKTAKRRKIIKRKAKGRKKKITAPKRYYININ